VTRAIRLDERYVCTVALDNPVARSEHPMLPAAEHSLDCVAFTVPPGRQKIRRSQPSASWVS